MANPLRVYVAGSSRELDRCVLNAAALVSAGIAITHKWWDAVIAARRSGWLSDADLAPAEQLRHALADIHGLQSADAVWVLWPFQPFTGGMAVELGYALAVQKPVFVSGPTAATCIFTAMTQRFESDVLALRAVIELASHRAAYASRIRLAGACPFGEVP